MAVDDLAAARLLITENHPGAAAVVGDRVFQKQLQGGYEAAEAIAGRARTFGDYRASLLRFAASFEDPHIYSQELVQVPRFWPGFRVALKDNRWIVSADAEEAGPEPGSVLVSCDGRGPDELALERLAPFHTNWSVRARRLRASKELLIDSGSLAHPRLRECTFSEPSGKPRTIKLEWKSVPPTQPAQPSAVASRAPASDLGLTEFEQGWWLRLGTSGGRAFKLLEEARLRQHALRAAPFVVLDLRGNDGGASYFTDALAEIIYGARPVAQARRPKNSQNPEQIVWRVSPAALQTLEAYVPRLSRIASPDHPGVRAVLAQRDEMRRALAAGEPLARAPAQVEAGAPEAASPTTRPPRVVLLTDRWCFSSCLQGVWLFRALGAIHVGEETDANTRYSELRTIDLPSGLSTFSTLQSYSTYAPMRFGPYVPSIRFMGDLSDDAAIKDWVRTAVLAQ